MNNFKITTIGGGTGTFVVLRGLKNFPVDLTAVVTVADSGGSTGRLRSEFGFLPIGDLRQSLAALADDKDETLTKLLAYRFSKGGGLLGHNLGNLILTALRDLYGTEPRALEKAAEIFRISGKILPVSLTQADLCAVYRGGFKVMGEHAIDQPKFEGGKKIDKIYLKNPVNIYSKARESIIDSDLLVLGPGDIYTSTIPCLLVDGVRTAIRKSRAKLVYILNLMNRYSQTYNFKASDYVLEVEKYAGRKVDYIIINKSAIPKAILNSYLAEKATAVEDDLNGNTTAIVVRGDFARSRAIERIKVDKVARSFWRHDEDKLARAIIKILL